MNPDVAAGGHPHISTGRRQHKFGVDWDDARRLYRAWRDSPWVRWQGISAHIGSQILSLTPFRRAAERLSRFVISLRRDGVRLRYFDFGGGLGIRYHRETTVPTNHYARALLSAVRPTGCHLLLEPGRYIVGPAGVLLTRVILTKQSHGKRFVVVDAAMNDLMRPALYSATHAITRAQSPSYKSQNQHSALADVVGPVCESGDCFLKDWPLGEVESGALLVIWGTGAYGFSLANNYNSRPRPAEVLVEGKRARLIRRRESLAGLLRGE